LFQITVAIKNDDVEKLKILYENGKLTLDDMKDLMEDVIIHNATSILDSVHNFFTEVITHQPIYEKYTLIAARSNSIDIFNELLTNKPFNLTVKFTKHLLGAINANSADIALETLITNSGHTGNKLFSMALEKNLKFVVEKFLKNNYISALEDDSDLVLSLFDIPFKDNNDDMVKLMLRHFDYDIRDEDEVAFYNEILDVLTEKAIRSDSSNIFKIITQLREGFDINRPLNEDGQNALLIAFTNQTLGMFDYLMEEYYNTPELLSEAINFSDSEGMNLWHYAIKYCAPADIGALLENMLQAFGVECINNTNKNGNTPLILAMYEGYVDAAAFFLRHEAEATLANKSGEKSMTKLSSGGLLETDSDYDGSDTDSEGSVSNNSDTAKRIMSSKLLDDQGWFEASEDEEASSPYKLNVTALGTTDDELPVF
jgi:ankyrin repeat protein